jgi:serine/threonine protein kinase
MIQPFKSLLATVALIVHPFVDSRMNVYFAYQLANALQYLSQLNLIHEDVATRNCLFFADYTIKLTDCARALPQYQHEYCTTTHGQLIPLRWIAPETLTVQNIFPIQFYSQMSLISGENIAQVGCVLLCSHSLGNLVTLLLLTTYITD